MANGIFRTSNREHRPLSQHLRNTFAAPALRAASVLSAEQVAEDTESIVQRLIAEVRVEPPRLGGMERGGTREGRARPDSNPGVRQGTTRHFVAIEVTGSIELLENWPDKRDEGLHVVDPFEGDGWTPPNATDPFDYDDAMRRHEYMLAQDLWFIGLRSDEGPHALYTWLDLTLGDEAEVERGERDIGAEISAQRAAIEPIVLAIAEQTEEFFNEELPGLLADMIESRRQWITARQAVANSLTFPQGWKSPEPQVVSAVDPGETQEPVKSGDGEVELPPTSRLADASFEDVLRTMRTWADAVERHPKAYHALHEDRMSDLLVATLNAALPGANREVYSRGGKSDLYIRASAVNSGAGPAKVFIAECKIWNGPANAEEALEQLFGYLEVKDTAGVLMFFVRLAQPIVAREKATAILTARADYTGASGSAVDGWPIWAFEHEGRTVRVCAAFVDIPG